MGGELGAKLLQFARRLPRNVHFAMRRPAKTWNESDNGKGKDEPGIDPVPKTAIRWILHRSMDLVEWPA
jgi:hypothetical protein